MKNKRVVLITGASSGIGGLCATYLAQKDDYLVFGTSRNPEKLGFLDDLPENLEIIKMNVNLTRSVERGIKLILKRTGRLDVVINSAGFSLAGSIEDTMMKEAKYQFETNFFGALRVCREVLPIMRKQQSGYIVNISSLAGLIGIPFQALYSASKFALEGLIETLRMEVRPFGIKVVLVEPGDFHTPFTIHRKIAKKSREKTVYHERFHKALSAAEESERKGESPEKIAYLIEKIINTGDPNLRYKIGPSSTLVSLKSFIPPRLAEWLIRKIFKI